MTVFTSAHFYIGRWFVVHDVFPFVFVDHSAHDLAA